MIGYEKKAKVCIHPGWFAQPTLSSLREADWVVIQKEKHGVSSRRYKLI
jgi:hypothetical protein